MNSEKFSLKWNDFQQTVSNSFGILKKEQDFFDVTLVSDDEVHLSSHKLVLSACSGFFKSILKKTSNPHPLIYLSGISSRNLQFIIDYIYHGEVEIYQEQLDDFLDVAQKLRIAGLNSNLNQDEKEETVLQVPDVKSVKQSISKPRIENRNFQISKENFDERAHPSPLSNSNAEKFNFPLLNMVNVDASEQEEKIKEMIDFNDGVFTCKVCGKTSNKKFVLQNHMETHIKGLSLPCQQCGKTFRSTASLKNHSYKFHIKNI